MKRMIRRWFKCISAKYRKMESLRISQFPVAPANEITDDMQIIINTSANQTKRASWGDIKSNATSEVLEGVVELTAAEIQTSNSSPYQLLPAAGAGKIIRVLDAEILFTYNAPAYTVGSMAIISGGAGNYQAISNDILFSTADTYSTFELIQGANLGNLAENQPLYLIALVSNPLNGNGTAIINFRYKIITI